MKILRITIMAFVLIFFSQAMALEPICQVLVYDNNPDKPILESKTVQIDSDPAEILGFSFSAQSLPATEEQYFAPVRLRISRSGFVASSLMRWRVGNVQLTDPAGHKAVGRCQR